MYQQHVPGALDAEMMKRLGSRSRSSNALRDERVLQLEAKRLGSDVDDERSRRAPVHRAASSRRTGTSWAPELRRRARAQGLSVSDFEEQLRGDILREKGDALITDGVQVAPPRWRRSSAAAPSR
jgi:hypothetical protein